jgi:hypothetical protein
MIKHTFVRLWALLALGLLAACGNASAPAAVAPTAARSATLSPSPSPSAPAPAATRLGSTSAPALPTAAPAATATGAIPAGLTAEGYHQLGRADAPVTLVMFSDFL